MRWKGDHRACCSTEHTEEEVCDHCPFFVAGNEGQEILRLFHLTAERHTDPKTHIKSISLSREGLQLAFQIYDVPDKERAFHYLALALNVMNGED